MLRFCDTCRFMNLIFIEVIEFLFQKDPCFLIIELIDSYQSENIKGVYVVRIYSSNWRKGSDVRPRLKHNFCQDTKSSENETKAKHYL